METLLELTMTPAPELVGMARLAVSLVAHRLNYSCAAVEDFQVAVGEACADAIAYGRRAMDADATLRVRCSVGSGLFVIIVEASGRACDEPQRRHQGPFPSEQTLSRLVLDALMDTVAYRCAPGRGMSIRMARALPTDERARTTTAAAPPRTAQIP
ncbi:MAG TPA: ATP-binding protein [Armatimonadota bacterium]|nr:ATP-binding protein [Armatimonadota bacterium]HOS42448.1 ATP-binding protein [Armatimonadota bacterium]